MKPPLITIERLWEVYPLGQTKEEIEKQAIEISPFVFEWMKLHEIDIDCPTVQSTWVCVAFHRALFMGYKLGYEDCKRENVE